MPIMLLQAKRVRAKRLRKVADGRELAAKLLQSRAGWLIGLGSGLFSGAAAFALAVCAAGALVGAGRLNALPYAESHCAVTQEQEPGSQKCQNQPSVAKSPQVYQNVKISEPVGIHQKCG